MSYWTLKETIFKTDGNTTIHEKPFANKNIIIRELKKNSPISSADIYVLTKNNSVEFVYNGLKRKFEITEEHE